MGSGGGGTSYTSTTIPTELKPLFAQTGTKVMGIQNQAAGTLSSFFNKTPQVVPNATPGQLDILAAQRERALGDPRTPEELMALEQAQQFLSVPFGELPSTLAGFQAIRNPILNETALAGLGNSDAVTSNLAAGLSPLLQTEMQMRLGLIPQLANLGAAAAQRESGLLGEYGQSEEAMRQIQAQKAEADYLDMVRRQQLGTQFTAGLLQPLPSALSRSTSTTTGGGMFK